MFAGRKSSQASDQASAQGGPDQQLASGEEADNSSQTSQEEGSQVVRKSSSRRFSRPALSEERVDELKDTLRSRCVSLKKEQVEYFLEKSPELFKHISVDDEKGGNDAKYTIIQCVSSAYFRLTEGNPEMKDILMGDGYFHTFLVPKLVSKTCRDLGGIRAETKVESLHGKEDSRSIEFKAKAQEAFASIGASASAESSSNASSRNESSNQFEKRKRVPQLGNSRLTEVVLGSRHYLKPALESLNERKCDIDRVLFSKLMGYDITGDFAPQGKTNVSIAMDNSSGKSGGLSLQYFSGSASKNSSSAGETKVTSLVTWCDPVEMFDNARDEDEVVEYIGRDCTNPFRLMHEAVKAFKESQLASDWLTALYRFLGKQLNLIPTTGLTDVRLVGARGAGKTSLRYAIRKVLESLKHGKEFKASTGELSLQFRELSMNLKSTAGSRKERGEISRDKALFDALSIQIKEIMQLVDAPGGTKLDDGKFVGEFEDHELMNVQVSPAYDIYTRTSSGEIEPRPVDEIIKNIKRNEMVHVSDSGDGTVKGIEMLVVTHLETVFGNASHTANARTEKDYRDAVRDELVRIAESDEIRGEIMEKANHLEEKLGVPVLPMTLPLQYRNARKKVIEPMQAYPVYNNLTKRFVLEFLAALFSRMKAMLATKKSGVSTGAT